MRGLRDGDEVFGFCPGAFAEYARAEADKVAPKPASLTFEQAAAVPMAATTALRGIRDVGEVRAGHRVLINGAAGGVGTYAVQTAAALGAEVTGVCSTRNVELVRSIGAAHVVDYTTEDFIDTRARYDVILDNVGSQPLSRLRRALAEEQLTLLCGPRLWPVRGLGREFDVKSRVVRDQSPFHSSVQGRPQCRMDAPDRT